MGMKFHPHATLKDKTMNLNTIKPKKYIVNIGKENIELKFDLRSFAYLEEHFESIEKALELFNKKDFDAIKSCFMASLLHCNKTSNINELMKKADPQELTLKIASTINDALAFDFGFDKEFDWALLYFIAKPVLHFSEEEFWQSTPKKILSMLRILQEAKGLRSKTLENEKAVEAFMAW